jgi:hypothetical protein
VLRSSRFIAAYDAYDSYVGMSRALHLGVSIQPVAADSSNIPPSRPLNSLHPAAIQA